MSQIAFSAPAAQLAPLRLTARGRLVLLALPLLMIVTVTTLIIGAWLAPASASQTHLTGPGTGLEEVTVMEGDSLWGLAREFAPSQDTREVVSRIASLNTDTGVLKPGQTLIVPSDAQD
ncbi:LysM peptidoglycan-binding domain-containing protein [Galactobacter valiniphilus]|uniref:LysM peptidoglycan-binding domain-containing protein n=1 Tax=Galactobacter valiniphilus TaxID=2676122 RepID=UPI0037365DE4